MPAASTAAAAVARLRAIAAARPTAVDAGLALGLYVVLTLGVTTAGELELPDGRLVGAAVNVLLVAPLAWRRRAPLVVLAVVGAAAAVSALALGTTGGEAAALVALCTVAGNEARQARVAAAVALTAAVAIAIVLALEPGEPGERVAGVVAALTAATAIGLAVRARRAALVALADRAHRLERERAQEAKLAVAAERARIARELHDVVAHNVTVMVALADGAQLTVEGAPDRARDAIGQVAATGRQALTELRGVLGVLRDGDRHGAPGDLHPQPAIAELDELLERVRRTGLEARLRVEGEPVTLGSVAQLTIYRIVQEALTNVLRHAHGASCVEVRLGYRVTMVELEIVDDGAPAPASNGAGRGVAGMRERAAIHGTGLEAGPSRTGGWRVATRIPLCAEATTR